jgi:hypothetical protein
MIVTVLILFASFHIFFFNNDDHQYTCQKNRKVQIHSSPAKLRNQLNFLNTNEYSQQSPPQQFRKSTFSHSLIDAHDNGQNPRLLLQLTLSLDHMPRVMNNAIAVEVLLISNNSNARVPQQFCLSHQFVSSASAVVIRAIFI